MKCFWIYLYIYICTHIYSLCVYVKNPHTNTAVLHWLFHFSVKDTRFQSLKSRTKVTAEDRGLAWCTFPCGGPSLLDSGSLQCMAYCMDRSHSSCHRSWHILDHRYRTQPRAYIGWLEKKKKADTGETWRNSQFSSTPAPCHSAASCQPLLRPFHSTDALLHFNKGITNLRPSSNTLGITGTWKKQYLRSTCWASEPQNKIKWKAFYSQRRQTVY